ncbi:hypothetical protein JRQ81_011273 [Phrynocephalus forsythii]|uniref:Uncharacterized protein n=1 Tax=Phrynocephalus forsythii TaxID=171643 RepID=A0A9Q0Y1S2_9SAUR|nr:hypothetical protein JRQ81_011273 [Phrynocephalus forsythii]
MNFSATTSPLRQFDAQGFIAFTPSSVTARKSDGLAMISIIVAVFVFLAILIVVMVHYGPQLRAIRTPLCHEPLPQDMDDVVRLIGWKKLGSQRNGIMPSPQPAKNSHAAGLNTQCERRDPNIIEITSL